MKKRLTLDMAWTLCMKQWASISQSLKKDPGADIDGLKWKWLKRHGYENIDCDCFFCEYNVQHSNSIDCNCPAKKIDEDFNCFDKDYRHDTEPHAFYKKIKSLHRKYKKRLKAKGLK